MQQQHGGTLFCTQATGLSENLFILKLNGYQNLDTGGQPVSPVRSTQGDPESPLPIVPRLIMHCVQGTLYHDWVFLVLLQAELISR